MKSQSIEQLTSFGASEKEILLFSETNSTSINYLSLLNNEGGVPAIEGVVVSEGLPILYFVNSTNLSNSTSAKEQQIEGIINKLACRGERSVFAIIQQGELNVFPISPGNFSSNKISLSSGKQTQFFIRNLIEGNLEKAQEKALFRGRASYINDLLFNLLKTVGIHLNSVEKLKGKHEVILGLVGRALLVRFLVDRKIITPDTFPEIYEKGAIENCFGNAENAALVNNWLDLTFNGDLLLLPVKGFENYRKWFSNLGDDVFNKLSLIVSHAQIDGQLHLPGFINFAHVPVGLLSEVYERYAHESLDFEVRKKAKDESIHYTPRHIAEYMLAQVFDSIDTSCSHKAKVLDPSCGAGVFVVSSFRYLIAEHWRVSGVRPDTYKIREILYQQITGFDINISALTLAALGLYLSALELDPEPLPTSKLKFDSNLIGTVLYHVRKKNEPYNVTPAVMGSLGSAVGSEHLGKYDVVIGNPPWSSFPKKMKHPLSKVIQDVALRRDSELFKNIADKHENPDQVPDLPFVWKSMEWAKPSASIAFVLHARFLFKNSPAGCKSRNDLFSALNVTGILNASALRQSNVWPNVSAQFCLLFAQNTIPTDDNYFHFISPQYEKGINDVQGRFRVDYQSAEPIQHKVLEQNHFLLKTLFRGTALDVSVINKIFETIGSFNAVRLKDYWDKRVGKHKNGQGYKVANKKKSAQELLNIGAVNLSKKDKADYIIKTEKLAAFSHEWLEAPRKTSIYYPPLVLVNKAIGADSKTVSVRISLDGTPVAYNESFYGYSTCGHPNAEDLAKYIFIILNSNVFLYYTLMVSSEYGVEREAIQKGKDVDCFPIIPFESLTKAQLKQVRRLFLLFQEGNDISIFNSFVRALYRLDVYEQQIIQDTLSTSLPISSALKKAQASVSQREIDAFTNMLVKVLQPHEIQVIFDSNMQQDSWLFFSLSLGEPKNLDIKKTLSVMADNSGASLIKFQEDSSLFIGMLNQYRYWTPSRARLLGLKLLKDSTSFFEA